MKLQNFRHFDPSQRGKGLPGGGKAQVWDVFAEERERLSATAAAIGAIVLELEDNPETQRHRGGAGRDNPDAHAPTRERDPRIAARRKAKALRERGALHCEACGFNFETRYGERSNGFIECHHTRTASALQPGEKTKID